MESIGKTHGILIQRVERRVRQEGVGKTLSCTWNVTNSLPCRGGCVLVFVCFVLGPYVLKIPCFSLQLN